MYKIAIAGKANTGKNSLSRILVKEMKKNNQSLKHKYMAFADPIKEMSKIMYPNIPHNHLYGKSTLRNEVIPNSFKDGVPLTVRQLLIDIGTGLGRSYNSNIWIENINNNIKSIKNCDVVIISDLRFKDELEFLKTSGFTIIKLYRKNKNEINHISESGQDLISDDEYDFIIDNNGSIKDLKNNAIKIIEKL